MSAADTTVDVATLPALLAPLFAKHAELAAAYLFGSVARGDSRPDSDLDVGVVYRGPSRQLHDSIAPQLGDAIARLLGIERVDVIDLEAQGPMFCHEVLCDGLRLYEGDAARRIDFESSTLSRAFDFRPTYELATRGKVAALRRWLRERHDLRPDPVTAGRSQSESRETR